MKNLLDNKRGSSFIVKFDLKMKLSLLFTMAAIFILQANTTFSQNKLTISVKNQNVGRVLDEIESASDYKFFFQTSVVDLSRVISIDVKQESLENVLEMLFSGTNTTYLRKQNNIYLQEKPAPVLQQRIFVISGTIVDSEGVPMPGVSIVQKDTGNGTETDFDGKYTIRVRGNSARLIYSYVGLKTVEKQVIKSEVINLVMETEATSLSEVIVTGYQNLSKERTAGSFTQIGETQIQQRPGSTNIMDRIMGQTTGLNTNPAFGGAFEIRGRSSILSINANPLVVVDGFPLADQLNLESINPEDVETVTILKDAAASSIWGSRAANGVVVIVTKRGGKNTPLRVDFSAFVEMEEKVDLNNLNLMTTAGEIALDQEFIDKKWTDINGLAIGTRSINDLHLAYLYRNGLSPDGEVWSQNTFDRYINELKQRNINEDWEKYLLRNAIQTTYNLSLSGGGDNNSFFGSLSYVDRSGQVKGDDNDRITMNLRNTFDFNDKISFTAGMTAALRKEKDNYLTSQFGFGNPIEMVTLAQPYDQLVDEDGQYIQKYYHWNPWMSKERESLVNAPYTYNALEEQRNVDNSSTLVDIRADFKLDIELFKDLTVSSSFRYERNTNDLDAFKSMNLPSWRNTVNDYYIMNPDTGNYQYGIPPGSEYLQERTYSKGWVFKNTINWDKTWNDHQLDIFAGGEYSRRFTEFSRNRQFGYDKGSTTYLPINEADLVNYRLTNWTGGRFTRYYDALVFDVNNQDNRFVSVFSNLGYTYKQKYTLNGSFRIDQANIFGSNPDFRYKPLWSVGAAWDATNEPFLANTDWIDRLKFRATYGLGGNSLIGVYPEATARVRNINVGNQYNSLVLNQPANPDLKWEETATTNFGLDFAFFNNRLSGSLDYYTKKSTDVYTSRPLDPTVGWTRASVNYADIDNKGVELLLNADLIRSEDFNWSVRANLNYNKNTLTTAKINTTPTADTYTGTNAYEEGKPIGATYAYNFAGLDNNGEVLLYDADGNTRSWRGNVAIEELKYAGSRVPKHYGGLSTTLNYKGIDLTVNMNYQADYIFKMSYNYASTGNGTYNNFEYDFSNIRVHEEWGNRWMQPGDEATTDVPKIFYNGVNPITGLSENRNDTATMHRIWNQSSRNVHKGDYIRVQDIILGYTMPSKLLKPTFFKNLRFSMQVTNPFLWVANDIGVDPIAPTSEAYTYLTRYTFGLRASF
ncbi:SusC/RagA family TonB-linked outer membrane protein [Zhouia spongiae]|uniref:SusC/RagA family TonB-linked outer membrane protein n=1 Tax=Zhouia spongiae TaxID=2202721 RepID=A0ABY3YL56_9FLAO|nr:SusC/RagA family TonB-linked outer membrane protein [Zhouia spongiae]UNY98562.1 SusC/RagA family TonB-linked outer membrane protein [Zhouia spongiae]